MLCWMLKLVSQKKGAIRAERHSRVFLYRRRLAELRCRRPVQIEADHPHSGPVEQLAFVRFGDRLDRRSLVKVQIRCKSDS